MSGVAVASHISCAIAFTLVTSILLGHRPTRTQFPILIHSCALTAIWAIFSTLFAVDLLKDYLYVSTIELLSGALWMLCLIRLLKLTQRINKQRWYFQPTFYFLMSALLLSLFLNALSIHFGWTLGTKTQNTRATFVGYIAFSVILLALVEQTYRGTVPERRWGIKCLCIGLGFMYCYEFFMYATALFFNTISWSIWEVRGAIAATIAPLIGLSALSHYKWQAEILPSRAVIFRSSVFVSCGVYLLLMGLVGYQMRQWSGTWGHALQVAFFNVFLIVFCFILSSGRLRAGTKLFISQNFFKLRYDYRSEWIRFSTLLSSYDDYRELPSRVIKALADMVESPRGMLFEWEEKRGYVLKECWNHDFNSELIIDSCSFTDFLQESKRSLELPSRFNNDNGLYDSIPLAIRQIKWAWLLVPLLHGNRLQAFVILAHPKAPFFNVNWEVLDLLSMAGQQAAICLVQEQNTQALAIARQFEEYNRFSTFVMHDLKNVLAQLQLIQCNKEKHGANPEFIKSFYQTVDHTTDKIDRLLMQLRKGQQKSKTIKEAIDIAKALNKVIQLNDHRQPAPRLAWIDLPPEVRLIGDEEKFITILCHLVENAQQATPLGGEVIISVFSSADMISISIQDTGCGMDLEFMRTCLYKPFVTTKGEMGMGIGVYEAREYAHAVGGKLTVETVKDKGSTFTLSLPIITKHELNVA